MSDTVNGAELAFATSQTLVAGQRYVAFLRLDAMSVAPALSTSLPLRVDNPLAGGRIVVSLATSVADLRDRAWTAGTDGDAFERNIDLWFRASFAPPAPVPEPASLALLGAGLLGLGLSRGLARRRRR